MYHYKTIRKYTAALLDFFNDIEVESIDTNGNVITKKIPVTYSSKEKLAILDTMSEQQMLKGNTNVLPRASLALSVIERDDLRMTNKLNKVNINRSEDSQQYQFNPIPMGFSYDLTILCRGMNEACQIIEEIVPKFNPNVALDIFDSANQDEPTRVPLQLLDTSIETEEYTELSMNIVTLNFGLRLNGYLYQPIKDYARIKELKYKLNTKKDTTNTIIGWDIVNNYPKEPSTIAHFDKDTVQLNDIQINNLNCVIDYTILQEHVDFKFSWNLLLGEGILEVSEDTKECKIIPKSSGEFEIECKCTDEFNNYISIAKTFIIPETL